MTSALPLEVAFFEALRCLQSPVLTRLMWACTLAGNTLVVVAHTALASLLLASRGRWRFGLLLAAVVGSSAALSEVLKQAFDRVRPPEALALIGMPGNASFPSGHALSTIVLYGSFAVLLTLGTPSKRARVTALVAAACGTLLVGVSRVYLGVHWPGDVLASWIVGGSIVTALALAARGWRDVRSRALTPRLRLVLTAIAPVAAIAAVVLEMWRHPLG